MSFQTGRKYITRHYKMQPATAILELNRKNKIKNKVLALVTDIIWLTKQSYRLVNREIRILKSNDVTSEKGTDQNIRNKTYEKEESKDEDMK